MLQEKLTNQASPLLFTLNYLTTREEKPFPDFFQDIFYLRAHFSEHRIDILDITIRESFRILSVIIETIRNTQMAVLLRIVEFYNRRSCWWLISLMQFYGNYNMLFYARFIDIADRRKSHAFC